MKCSSNSWQRSFMMRNIPEKHGVRHAAGMSKEAPFHFGQYNPANDRVWSVVTNRKILGAVQPSQQTRDPLSRFLAAAGIPQKAPSTLMQADNENNIGTAYALSPSSGNPSSPDNARDPAASPSVLGRLQAERRRRSVF